MSFIIYKNIRINKCIIDKHNNEWVQEVHKHSIHQSHENNWGIDQTK